jgi:hypothetical protein
MKMNLDSQTSKKRASIALLIGALIAVFSVTFVFKTNLPIVIENRIYFRGILLGSILMISGSAVILNKDVLISSILYSLASGNLALIIISTLNLIYDKLIDLYKYFDWTFGIVLITLLILIIIRLWLKRILALLNL